MRLQSVMPQPSRHGETHMAQRLLLLWKLGHEPRLNWPQELLHSLAQGIHRCALFVAIAVSRGGAVSERLMAQ